MTITTFFILSAVLTGLGVIAVVVGAVVYLKRRGVLRAAADAAKTAVTADVQDAANKL